MKKLMLAFAAFSAVLCAKAIDTYDREAAYVESTGAQYVDTGVIGRSGTKIEAVFMYTALKCGTSNDLAFMGARKDSGNTRFFPFHCVDGAASYGYGAFGYFTSAKYITANVLHTLVADMRVGSQTAIYDGVALNQSGASTSEIDTGKSMYLFALNYSGAKNFAMLRIYSLKIYQTDANGEYRLVRDFIPCAKNEEGALFDRVNGKLYQSASGTALNVAPSRDTALKAKGRPDYLVEYIGSDGSQVLDTGVPMRTGVKAEGKMRWNALDQSEHTYLGGRGNGTDDRFYMVHAVKAARFFSLGALKLYKGDYAVAQDYEFSIDYPSSLLLTASFNDYDESLEEQASKAIDTGYNLSLFSALVGGDRTYGSKARCYWLKLYLDGELVRDFVPCVKDGKGALYDKIKDEVVFPTGDIDVSACGPEAEPLDGWEYREAVYVESTGAEYVDTGVIGKSGCKAMADVVWLSDSLDQGFLGSRSAPRYYLLHNTNGQAGYGYGDGTKGFVKTGIYMARGCRYVMESELDHGCQRMAVSAYGSGVTNVSSAVVDSSIDTGVNMYLFAENYNGPMYAGPSRLRMLKLWEKDEQTGEYVLERDFRPVSVKMKGSWDNAFGALRDEVSGEIFFAKAIDGGDRVSLSYRSRRGLLIVVE